jgi:hypothetical protein
MIAIGGIVARACQFLHGHGKSSGGDVQPDFGSSSCW